MADTLDAGDLIAPLAEVLKRLEGKITIAEAEALITSFADDRIRQVKPGDLITAQFFNQVIVDLEELRRRVSDLEGTSTAPVLTRIDPPDGVRVGSLVTLFGTGFNARDTTNRIVVQFADQEIDTFTLGSGVGVLTFTLPDSFGTLPRQASVRVWVGPRASNAMTTTIHPKTAPQQGGQVVIAAPEAANDPPGNIIVGSKLSYSWEVDSQAAQAADYNFDLVISNLTGATEAAWRNSLTLEPATTTLNPGQKISVKAAITVPAGAQKARFALGVTTDPAITLRLPASVDVTVGAPPDASDPRARVGFDRRSSTFTQVTPIIVSAGNTLDGLKVSPGGTTVEIVLVVEPQLDAGGRSGAGYYDFEVEIEGADQGWTALRSPVKADDIARGNRQQVTLFITNSAAVGAGNIRMLRLWARHRPSASGPIDFSSFHRFPVDGR